MKLNPIACRNALLWFAGACMCFGIALQPQQLIALFSIAGLIAFALKAFAAMFAAFAAREFAYGLFRNPSSPWYASITALLYLAVVLCLINALIIAVQIHLLVRFGVNPIMSGYGVLLVFMAFELFWTAILEWPHYIKRF